MCMVGNSANYSCLVKFANCTNHRPLVTSTREVFAQTYLMIDISGHDATCTLVCHPPLTLWTRVQFQVIPQKMERLSIGCMDV